MTGWLIDTFIWTGALIALVLLIRRPAAQLFGPTFAYALWLLPLLRFVLPPIVLPAWMAPAQEAVPVTAGEVSETVLLFSDAESFAAAPQGVMAAETGFAMTDLLLPVWLAGAAAFLAWRIIEYRRMRADLLEDAIPLGEKGGVRIVESSAVSSPIAFGVRDKVVALPPGLIAHENRTARDLAIAHELAHHRGGDLIVNLVAQPVLALHWFNPLAWLGWRAMRRDQEAACDARVLASEGRETRATYGEVIASFAGTRHHALAAPMACPVLGEKSVIHRLQSLNMNDVSAPRRMAGRLMLGAAALALPLTASVSYAEQGAPEPPAAPAALAPSAPAAPPAPPAPPAPNADEFEEAFEQAEAELDRAEAELDRADAEIDRAERRIVLIERSHDDRAHSDKDKTVKREVHVHRVGDQPLSDEEMAELRRELAEMRKEFRKGGKLDKEMEQLRRDLGENGKIREEVRLAFASAKAEAPEVIVSCSGEEPITESVTADGRKVMMICKSKIMANAADGIRRAREQIAKDPNLSEDVRGQVLQSLDREIARITQDS